jgi:hypothetical protein
MVTALEHPHRPRRRVPDGIRPARAADRAGWRAAAGVSTRPPLTPYPYLVISEVYVSHIVQIQTEVRDPLAVTAACRRLSLPQPIDGEHQLFTNRLVGLGVQLPGWRFAVVCQTDSGQVQYDNYGGRWGESAHLDGFLQGYAVERASSEARRLGHSVTEQTLDDGSIRLTVQVGG